MTAASQALKQMMLCLYNQAINLTSYVSTKYSRTIEKEIFEGVGSEKQACF